MKTKTVFYLCLILSIVFFGIGFSSGYWFFVNWILLGAALMKIAFWIVGIGLAVLFIYLLTRKKSNDETGN